jgi:hypothetical protein
MGKDNELLNKRFSQEKAEMLDALSSTMGNVSESAVIVAKSKGLTDGSPEFNKKRDAIRRLHYYWMECDADYSNYVESIDGLLLDLAESKMKIMINNGDSDMVKFILKTKGKKRGYTERTETDITSGGKALEIKFNIKPPSK